MADFDFEIRRVKYSEIEGVMDVNETTLPENYPRFFYERIIEKFHESFLVAYPTGDPDNIVGYIMWRVERGASSFSTKYVKKAHLVSIAILQNYRRKGIASKIIMESIKAIEDNYKVDEYILEVRVSNYAAVKMYEKLGFERIKIIESYYRDSEDAYFMAKNQKSNYAVGSKNMLVADLKKFYQLREMNGFIFLCPKCEYSYVKNIKWQEPGYEEKTFENSFNCVNCNATMKMKDIIDGSHNA